MFDVGAPREFACYCEPPLTFCAAEARSTSSSKAQQRERARKRHVIFRTRAKRRRREAKTRSTAICAPQVRAPPYESPRQTRRVLLRPERRHLQPIFSSSLTALSPADTAASDLTYTFARLRFQLSPSAFSCSSMRGTRMPQRRPCRVRRSRCATHVRARWCECASAMSRVRVSVAECAAADAVMRQCRLHLVLPHAAVVRQRV